ncbi:MAG: von Willebrand factor type A domain-containing protein [Actinomycetota bacterium]
MHETYGTPITRSRSLRWRWLLAVVAVLALAAAACGDSDDDAGFDFAEETEAPDRDDGGEFRGGDAEELFTDDTEAADETEAPSPAFDAEAPESTEAPAEDAGETTDGGFFDEGGDDAEAELAPDRDRTEGNTFQDYGVRSFVDTDRDPLSTFALDVDTASYSIGRQWISEGAIPPTESVRVEEYVNSFEYDYSSPRDGLTVLADGGPSPFDQDNVIVRLGVQAEQVDERDRPDASLTFVIDTSGSMDQDGRIELVKASLIRLVEELRDEDRIAIVTYGSDSRVWLEPTRVSDDDLIVEAIEALRPSGSTNLEAGLELGYGLADEMFDRDRINRVILTSDGVANAGLTDPDGLARMIRDDADRGVQLISVGVGMGNFNDVVLETLANDGDGFYRYVNTRDEAEDLFSENLVSSLLTVAIDGKIQVEFDDDTVRSYRLLGFENRAVRDDDFRDDDVDAGELGAGHQVTALYELELWDRVDERDRLGTAQLRWEDPDSGEVIETRLELDAGVVEARWADTSEDFRLAVTAGAFAEKLRDSQYARDLSFEQIANEAEALRGRSADVRELVELIWAMDRLA